MITSIDRAAHEVKTRGFAIAPGVVTTEKAAELAGLLQECIDEDVRRFGSDGPDYWMVPNLMARHVEFAHLMENALLQKHLNNMLDNTCIVYAYTSSLSLIHI